ncbi:toxic anion resistance protein [Bacillus sp. RG28]|uniref:Toxic anion resistance protein n=1 Tax=Gottfriedia endophytica TaxID=2820819 RepID=A0A940NSB9_9BACI|nr:toxic anion resistance protein [Gottfriedia endophytica]MBP0726638.1 toxic anion resistance protein [Gottfriedia endophytica]
MSFSMEVVSQEEIKSVIEEQIKPVPEEVKKLKESAENNVAAIMSLELESTEGFGKRSEILKSIEEFGLDTMKTSASKNNLLQVSVGKLSKSGDEGGHVAKGLSELQFQIKDLDPSVIDFAKTGFLSKLFNPLRVYFQKYEKADAVISDIVVSLEKGKTTLQNDNTTLTFEQQSLRELTKILQKEIQLGTLMDESIEQQIETARNNGTDQQRVQFISEEVLFPLRQRVMDLQQMQVVNQQGIMAYEVVIRNNKELIRGVERAKTVTISALKIAVTVASALYNQKIVLKKLEALNKTTNELIAGTSKMLKEQGVEIQKQAMETGVSVETLKGAFADVLSALDSISTYKQNALPKMRETINQFKQLADNGEKQILRLEKGNQIGLN